MFSKILLTIKGASLAVKITAIVATALVIGGVTTTIILVVNNPSNETDIVAHQNNEDKKQDSEPQSQKEQVSEQDKETRQEEQSQEEQSKKGQKEQQEDQPNDPKTPNNPETPAEPTPQKTCSDFQNCDYNLNDKYIIETQAFDFYSLPEGITHICNNDEHNSYKYDLPIIETKTFYQIGNFTGNGGNNVPHAEPTRTTSYFDQANNYAATKGLFPYPAGWGCGGMGDVLRPWTWEETISKGFALDEEKCAYWGLSCGRW